MTLTEIAQYAGEKVGKTDSDTLTFLQKAASLAYRRVWDFAPWRETVTNSTYSVGTNRQITLGSNVETPLSVAYNDTEVDPIDLATIVSQDPGLLDDARTGDPDTYHFTGRNSSGVAQLNLYPRLATSGTIPLRVVEKLKCLRPRCIRHAIDLWLPSKLCLWHSIVHTQCGLSHYHLTQCCRTFRQ